MIQQALKNSLGSQTGIISLLTGLVIPDSITSRFIGSPPSLLVFNTTSLESVTIIEDSVLAFALVQTYATSRLVFINISLCITNRKKFIENHFLFN